MTSPHRRLLGRAGERSGSVRHHGGMSRFSGLVRMGSQYLRSPQGKRAGSTAVDRAAGVAGRLAGQQHAAKIEKARTAAQRGLHRL